MTDSTTAWYHNQWFMNTVSNITSILLYDYYYLIIINSIVN